MKYLFRTALFLTLILSLTLQAAEKSSFVGRYSASERESITELYILDNHTFCYLFMGGSLDVMMAGTWQKSDKDQDTIKFKDNRSGQVTHPATGQYLNRIDNKISIVIDGYSLRDVNMAVFAISKEDKLPTTFKPLLPKNNSRGRISYSLPLITPSEAHFFYIGSQETSQNSDGNRIKVSQYKVGDYDTIRFGFNSQQSLFQEEFNGQMVDGELFINGDSINRKTELAPQMQQEVTEYCISPNTEESEEDSVDWTVLIPSKTFFVDKESVNSEPYFNENDGEQARQENGINALVQDEKQLFEQYYQKAKKDLNSFNELLAFAVKLLQVKQRKNVYAPYVSMKLSQLLVDTNGLANFKSAEEQLNAYATQIYPLIKNSTDRQVKYSVLVMASQGAIIYGVTRKDTVFATVVDSLLGADFDINTTINPTLAYNLACIYALNKNKVEMLKAIKAARKMKKPAEQFLKDADFKFYRADSEFLAAVNNMLNV
ncbi:MAG: hypothetical protein MJK12_05275 [Colwellia sp.]|nr:hypothetical protein [Colwellia sp.]